MAERWISKVCVPAVRNIFFVLLLFSLHAPCYAREVSVLRRITDGDTIPHYMLDEVKVKGRSLRKYARRQSRLEYNVRKVYPYARIAARKIEQINHRLALTPDSKKRKEVIRREYRELMKTFKKPLMRLSFTQGRILVKLIYRETDHSAFSHIHEYKGGVNAYFWQSIALIFGNNLKTGYEPEERDAEIEKIVLKIKSEEQESGNIGK